MISESYPELRRLQIAACAALTAAGVNPGELVAETEVRHLGHTAAKYRHMMHVAWVVGATAGVGHAVVQVSGPAHEACLALWRECEREQGRDAA